jgi:2-succinyl-5-enolpyruvyl-6-hydroxy-3-cyclohexene-1-carboxylate synthase
MHSVVDERSAAFFALGMAIKHQHPVALVCTSGTALLNYSPAIAEAYYLGVPLVVLSADRPEELIDTGIGQSIRQKNVYSNFQKGFLHLGDSQKVSSSDLLTFLYVCMNGKKGPIHLNLPFSEPLYETIERDNSIGQKLGDLYPEKNENPEDFIDQLKNSSKVLLLTGMLEFTSEERRLLVELIENHKVFHLQESTSRLDNVSSALNIDRILATCDGAIPLPDLVITIGEHIISKRIKQVLRKSKVPHFHIHPHGVEMDVFGSMEQTLSLPYRDALEMLHQYLPKNQSYFDEWKLIEKAAHERHQKFTRSLPYSDLGVFLDIIQRIPSSYHVHSGNSSVVRYIQLFDYRHLNYFHANRGTSGIDGSTSTAIGYAVASGAPTLLITGDLSFLYDSNALWIKNIPDTFRIIVINNNGGGIFRFIPGPLSVENHETFFEGTHQVNIQKLAEAFQFNYSKAEDFDSLKLELDSFFETGTGSRILEVQTPRELNDQVLKRYFNYLKSASSEFLY